MKVVRRIGEEEGMHKKTDLACKIHLDFKFDKGAAVKRKWCDE